AALEGGDQDRAAVGGLGPDHGLAAGRRARRRRDRAAAVHQRLRARYVLQPRRPDELAAAADLHRRRPGAGPARDARPRRRADARHHDPAAEPDRPCLPTEEPNLMSDPVTSNSDAQDALNTAEPAHTSAARPEVVTRESAPVTRRAGAIRLDNLQAWYGDHLT